MKYVEINIIFLFTITLVSSHQHIEPIVLVHGGADDVHTLRVEARKEVVKKAAMLGYKILKNGGSVVNAVEEAVKIMETDANFNAGYGSALNKDGEIEMDAAIMVGSNLLSGAVSGVKSVAHPISLARSVMENSSHFLLTGEGAKRFAQDRGMPLTAPNNLIAPTAKQDYQEYMSPMTGENARVVKLAVGSGGIGAIALDSNGHVAAASSSGGSIGKLAGRASDASIVGAGLYADDEVGAAVTTGHGEAIARYVMAHEIVNAMKRGFDAGVATRNAVKGITERFRKPTGAITVAKNGQVGISFTTDKMAWAYQLRDDVHYGVDDYDHFSERIKI